MLKTVPVKIADIYIPADRKKEIDERKIEVIAESIMSETSQRPIQVRQDKKRYVLVKGVNRLEAHKALGEVTIDTYIVSAQKH